MSKEAPFPNSINFLASSNRTLDSLDRLPREISVGATVKWLRQRVEWNIKLLVTLPASLASSRRLIISDGDDSHWAVDLDLGETRSIE
jgi:hypothetical protein